MQGSGCLGFQNKGAGLRTAAVSAAAFATGSEIAGCLMGGKRSDFQNLRAAEGSQIVRLKAHKEDLGTAAVSAAALATGSAIAGCSQRE